MKNLYARYSTYSFRAGILASIAVPLIAFLTYIEFFSDLQPLINVLLVVFFLLEVQPISKRQVENFQKP